MVCVELLRLLPLAVLCVIGSSNPLLTGGKICVSNQNCPKSAPYCANSLCRPVTTSCKAGETGLAGCNRCSCARGGWACTRRGCIPPFRFRGAVPCSAARDLPQCRRAPRTPPSCRSNADCPKRLPYCGNALCRPVTSVCREGERGVAACNRCFCAGGRWGCTKIGCPKPWPFDGAVPCSAAPDLCPAGEVKESPCNVVDCAPTRPFCMVTDNGQPLCVRPTKRCEDGDVGTRGCNTCFCSGGSWSCTEKACQFPVGFPGAVPCRDTPQLKACVAALPRCSRDFGGSGQGCRRARLVPCPCPRGLRCCRSSCGPVCQPPTTPKQKPGRCKRRVFIALACNPDEVVNTCNNDDSQCPGEQKCCRTARCVTSCEPPDGPKPGQCPAASAVEPGSSNCDVDSDCGEDNRKCCTNSDGNRRCALPTASGGAGPVRCKRDFTPDFCAIASFLTCRDGGVCPGNLTCCRSVCGDICQGSSSPAPGGRCPDTSGIITTCDFRPERGDCIRQSDCAPTKLCCPYGCGKRCLDPVK